MASIFFLKYPRALPKASWGCLFIILGCAGSLLRHGLSLTAAGRGSSLAAGCGFSGSGLFCGTRARRCADLSGGARLRSCGSLALEHRPSSPAAQGLELSCSAASGVISDQGLKPRVLHWQADCLLLSHQGNPAFLFYDVFLCRV